MAGPWYAVASGERPAPPEERSRLEPTAQLPAMLTALMFGALLAAYTR
jgi:hypothetical protein